MNPEIRSTLVVLVLFIFILATAEENPKAQWRGKIESENGIR